MALTHIAFCNVGVYANSTDVPVTVGDSVVSEAITPSGSNQQSSAATRTMVRVSTDTAVYVAFGANPDATTTTGRYYMHANSSEWFSMTLGHKVAVMTA